MRISSSISPGERILLAITLLAVFALATCDITEHDYWWHLKTGEYIVQNRTVPQQDVFSYTARLPWIAHYWLADVFFYLMHLRIGTPGLILFNASLITASLCLVLAAARTRGGPFLLALILAYLAALASRSRFYVRPETFSFFFTSLYVCLYAQFKSRGKSYPLVLFPFLQFLWFNIYGGGAITGLVLLGVLFSGECANLVLGRVFPSRRGLSPISAVRLRALALSVLASVALSFINPNGYRTVFYFTLSRSEIFRHIAEWKPTTLRDLLGPLGIVILLGGLSFIGRRRKSDMADVAVYVSFSAVCLNAWRALPFLALVSLPLIAFNLGPCWNRLFRRPGRRKWLAVLSALSIMAFTPWYLFRDLGYFQRDYAFGLGVNKKLLPLQACEFIETHDIKGNMFNSYGIGGYLIWRFWPERKVFVDGRVEMYGLPFLAEYMAYWVPDVWKRYERDYSIDYAIIDREPQYTTRFLDDNPEWALVFFDDRALVYLKKSPENLPLIERIGYRHLRPGSLDFSYLDPLVGNRELAGEVVAELERSLHSDETYNLNAHLMLGYAYTRLGLLTYHKALEHYRAALAIMPESRDIPMKIAELTRAVGRP